MSDDSTETILRRPQSLTPNEEVPPQHCLSCMSDSFTWDEDRECWDCDRCPSATHPPNPESFYLCPHCGHPFPERFSRCKKCRTDWSELVEAQA